MLNVSITKPELERIIEDKVKSGEYASADEVVAAAISLLDIETQLNGPELEEVRQAVLLGALQADRGEFAEFTAEDIIEEQLRAKRARREGKGE